MPPPNLGSVFLKPCFPNLTIRIDPDRFTLFKVDIPQNKLCFRMGCLPPTQEYRFWAADQTL